MHPIKLLHQRWTRVLGDSGRLDTLASRLDEKLNAVFLGLLLHWRICLHPAMFSHFLQAVETSQR